MSARIVTAAVVIIGNEILSGRTQDTNLRDIALGLGKRGIRIAEARVIPDVEATIVSVVNELRAALGPDIAFVHGAAGIARRIAFLTQGQPFLRKSPDAAIFTGDLSAAQRLRPAIEAHGLMEIESL